MLSFESKIVYKTISPILLCEDQLVGFVISKQGELLWFEAMSSKEIINVKLEKPREF